MEKKENKQFSVFKTLNAINVNEHTEKKKAGGSTLTYLSWAWAWRELMKVYPDATYEVTKYGEGKQPYYYDENLGYMCHTTMTIEGMTREMWLPVMNGANKAMKAEPYTYQVYNTYNRTYESKTVEAATMFDINKTIMRCLVKNIGMFGLGLYIYAGEDLPEDEKQAQQSAATPAAKTYSEDDVNRAICDAENCDTSSMLTKVWEGWKNIVPYDKNSEFYKAVAKKGAELKAQGK